MRSRHLALALVLLLPLPAEALAAAGRDATATERGRVPRTPVEVGLGSPTPRRGDVRRAHPDPAAATVNLSPLFVTQFDGSRYANVNCNMAAAAMLLTVQTGREISAAQLRRIADTGGGGTTQDDVRRAFARVGQPVDVRYGISFSAFRQQVRSGRSAIVAGWYRTLPSRADLQPGYGGAHAVFVLAYRPRGDGGRGAFYVMDPIGQGRYAGAWWSAAMLRRYGWTPRPFRDGGRSFRLSGVVILEVRVGARQMLRSRGRPAIAALWSATKDLMSDSRSIRTSHRTARRAGRNLRNAVLAVHDPALRLRTADARRGRRLDYPVPRALAVRYVRDSRELVVRVRAGTPVRATAPGRIFFRMRGPEGIVVWVMHGPGFFTRYAGVTDVRARVGTWVPRGARIGRVAGAEGRPTRLRLAVLSGRAWSPGARQDPRPFLPPLPRRLAAAAALDASDPRADVRSRAGADGRRRAGATP